jgi:hypothetical protein
MVKSKTQTKTEKLIKEITKAYSLINQIDKKRNQILKQEKLVIKNLLQKINKLPSSSKPKKKDISLLKFAINKIYKNHLSEISKIFN